MSGRSSNIGPFLQFAHRLLKRKLLLGAGHGFVVRATIVEFVNLFRKTYNALPKNYESAGWDALHIAAKALQKAGPDASPEAIAKAMRGPYKGVTASYDLAAEDMTGIELSSYIYSKLVNGKFTRLPFTAK